MLAAAASLGACAGSAVAHPLRVHTPAVTALLRSVVTAGTSVRSFGTARTPVRAVPLCGTRRHVMAPTAWHAVPVRHVFAVRHVSTCVSAWAGDASAASATAENEPGLAGEGPEARAVTQEDTDPDGIIPMLIRIQEIVKHDLQFPRYIALGNQSAGKTSALEALIGLDILPKGQDMVTRRPLEVTMVRTGSGEWVEFEDKEKVYDFEVVKSRIREENLSINGVSNEPLRIKVFAPHFHNLTIVDLPGYINAVKPPMPHTVPKQITDMIQPYIDDERNIMLVVCSATEDLANSMGLARAQQADHSGRRSMGVITKCDLPKYKHTLIETLQNRNFPLGLGYVGVRCRTQTELQAGVGFEELMHIEEDFFGSPDFKGVAGVRTGMPLLRKELSATLLRKIATEFPRILRKLDAAIEEARKNESFLDTLAKEPNLKTVSKELEKLVTQLHPAADSRRSFEEKLRADVHKLVEGMWQEAARVEFDFKGHELVTEAPYEVENVRSEARTLLKALGVRSSNDVTHMQQLPSMLVHGLSPLQDTSNKSLDQYKQRAIASGALAAYYKPEFPRQDVQREHREWNKGLVNAVDHVIVEQEGVNQCFELLLNSLRDFADNADSGRNPGKAHLARLFFRYLLEKIALRIQQEGLEETIVGMLDREKRPHAEYSQLLARLAAAKQYPKDFSWFLGDKNPQLRVPVYGRDWTEAYLGVVGARTADDIFRILAVRMLDPLIFECLSFSLNMFRADKIVKEADKQSAYLEELERYRDVLTAAAERYHGIVNVDL